MANLKSIIEINRCIDEHSLPKDCINDLENVIRLIEADKRFMFNLIKQFKKQEFYIKKLQTRLKDQRAPMRSTIGAGK